MVINTMSTIEAYQAIDLAIEIVKKTVGIVTNLN